MEEVVVPLDTLLRFLRSDSRDDHVLVDLCAGKGFFAFCVAELAATCAPLQQLSRIVVLDRADIDWSHFDLRGAGCVPVYVGSNSTI